MLSIPFHSEGCPLLVSSALLRSRDMGQVDLSRLRKVHGNWVIEIAEVKSSLLGGEMFLRGQRGRLHSSQKFLSGILGYPSRLVCLLK
jgi:hypothetical protein